MFEVKKYSLEGSGQGGEFGVNGQSLPVAASPVALYAAHTSRCGPLAHPLAPTVEML